MSDTADDARLGELLAGFVRDAGYRAVVDVDGTAVHSAANGLKFSAQTFPNATVQFYMGVGLSNERFGHADANQFNKQFRFGKCYLIERDETDRSALLEHDFFLDLDAPEAAAEVERIFDTWSITLRNFMEFLSKTVHGSDSDEA